MSTRHVATCDCGWTSNPCRSHAQAAYALRRHSCDAHRAREARAARVAARKAASGPARDCTHLDEHGQPRHHHGERNAYVLDRCRCRACRDAASTYERRRAKDRAYGRDAYVDATPVREHVHHLQAQGMGWKRIADAANLERSVVWKLLYGDPTRGQTSTKRVMPKTRDALLAVTLDLAPGLTIDGTGTRRRLQALVTIGWSISELGRRLDILPSNLATTIHGRKNVTVATRDKVTALYDHLWDTPAHPSGRHGSVPARARAYAARHGWVPPLAWDDATIDDPSATPCTGDDLITPQDRASNRGTGRVNPDALHDCITTWGMNIQQTADRLHVTRATVEQAISRLDPEQRDTLREQARRNAIVHTHGDAA